MIAFLNSFLLSRRYGRNIIFANDRCQGKWNSVDTIDDGELVHAGLIEWIDEKKMIAVHGHVVKAGHLSRKRHSRKQNSVFIVHFEGYVILQFEILWWSIWNNFLFISQHPDPAPAVLYRMSGKFLIGSCLIINIYVSMKRNVNGDTTIFRIL